GAFPDHVDDVLTGTFGQGHVPVVLGTLDAVRALRRVGDLVEQFQIGPVQRPARVPAVVGHVGVEGSGVVGPGIVLELRRGTRGEAGGGPVLTHGVEGREVLGGTTQLTVGHNLLMVAVGVTDEVAEPVPERVAAPFGQRIRTGRVGGLHVAAL